MRHARGAALVVALVLLAGCVGGDPADPGTGATPGFESTTTTAAPAPEVRPADVLDRTFTATADDIDGYDLVAGTDLQLTFADGQLAVAAGCTTMVAPFDLGGGRLSWTVSPVAAPVSCPGERQLQDAWALERFLAGFEVTATDGGLLLRSDDPAIDIALEAGDATAVDDDRPLLGTTWEVVTVIRDGEASVVPAELQAPTLRLPVDGGAELFGGCNQGSAPAEVEAGGDVVRLGEVAITRTSCSEAADQLEATVLEILDGAVFAQVSGDSLTITKGTSALVLRAA